MEVVDPSKKRVHSPEPPACAAEKARRHSSSEETESEVAGEDIVNLKAMCASYVASIVDDDEDRPRPRIPFHESSVSAIPRVLVAGWKFKFLFDRCSAMLSIVSAASDAPHSRGVADIVAQVVHWVRIQKAQLIFVASTDGNFQFGDYQMAPDCALRPIVRSGEKRSWPRVVIELEVGHRTYKQMRLDFKHYFEASVDIRAVLGIKINCSRGTPRFGDAVAVLWQRSDSQSGDVAVVSAVIFGNSAGGLSAKAKTALEETLDSAMPPVRHDQWNRCVPPSSPGDSYSPPAHVTISPGVILFDIANVARGCTFTCEEPLVIDLGRVFDACMAE